MVILTFKDIMYCGCLFFGNIFILVYSNVDRSKPNQNKSKKINRYKKVILFMVYGIDNIKIFKLPVKLNYALLGNQYIEYIYSLSTVNISTLCER